MWIEKVTCKYFSHMLKINTNDAIYLDEFFIVIVASVSESGTLYMCHGHVTRNAKSREHTYACIVSPYVCVFVLEKLREHRLHWCHVVPGWLSPRRIASRCYVKNGNEPQTSSSSSFPSSPSLSFLISSLSPFLRSFFLSLFFIILLFFFFSFILHSPLHHFSISRFCSCLPSALITSSYFLFYSSLFSYFILILLDDLFSIFSFPLFVVSIESMLSVIASFKKKTFVHFVL